MEKILSTILLALVHAASLLAQPVFVPDGEIPTVLGIILFLAQSMRYM